MSKRFFSELMSQADEQQAANVITRAVKKVAKGKRVASKLTVSEATKKYVKRAITAHSEKKQYTEAQGPSSLILSTSGTVPLMYDLAPAISYGTGNGNRVGNKVNVLKSSLTVTVFKNQAALGADDKPCRVMFLIGRVIESPTTTPSTSDLDKLFWVDGAATDTFESGGAAAFYRPINKDYWDIRYRSPVLNVGNASGNNVAVTTNSGNNNDFKLVHDIDVPIWKFWPKTIKFDASSSGSTNCNWFIIFCLQKIDYTVATATFSAPGATVCTNFIYEDA